MKMNPEPTATAVTNDLHQVSVTVKNTPKKPWQQEDPEAWLDRVLELRPGNQRSFTLFPGDGDYLARQGETIDLDDRATFGAITIPHPRMLALRSVTRQIMRVPSEEDFRPGDGVALIITDHAFETFLVTRKDNQHPNPKCRGKLSLMGGNREEGESFRECLIRELYEEVRDVTLADAIAAQVLRVTDLTVDSVQWEGSYRVAVFAAVAPFDTGGNWLNGWMRDGNLSEAQPNGLGRDEILRLAKADLAEPGKHFLANHGKVLRIGLNFLKDAHWP